MCGISGVLDFENSIDKKTLKDMNGAYSHRGPDTEGIFLDENIGLAHKRLKIIDLSEKASQPMTNQNNDIFIVFNGEIYNFLKLKERLLKKGYKFKNNSDTEVILCMYEEYGFDCVKQLKGIFSFAIWDSNKKSLFLARDHLGVKPLYYAHFSDVFLFSSEIKSLLEYKHKKFSLDNQSIHFYLSLQYTPEEKTIFKEIKKVLPGHYLILKEKKIIFKKYWDIDFSKNEDYSHENAISKKLKQLLTDSVKSQLISDVPLGFFLSGGVDSSIITGIASQIEKNINTFSVGFDSSEEFNELKYAKIASEHFNTNHHELIVNSKDVLKLLPKIIYQLDEPLADFAALPTYILSKFAKKKITVALTGEGADELFGGYPKYSLAKIPHIYDKLFSFSKSHHLIKNSASLFGFRRIEKMGKIMSLSKEKRHSEWDVVFNNEEKEKLCLPSFGRMNSINDNELSKRIKKYYSHAKTTDFLNKMLYTDIKTWLPEDLLMKVDKMSMLASLEARVPFLDKDLVQYSARIPSKMKIKKFDSKYILKKAFKDMLPKPILKRKKHGFNLPVAIWFKKEMKHLLPILTEDKTIKRGFFNKKYIEKIIDSHLKNNHNYGNKLWTLLTFELWNRYYIDKEKLRPL